MLMDNSWDDTYTTTAADTTSWNGYQHRLLYAQIDQFLSQRGVHQENMADSDEFREFVLWLRDFTRDEAPDAEGWKELREKVKQMIAQFLMYQFKQRQNTYPEQLEFPFPTSSTSSVVRLGGVGSSVGGANIYSTTGQKP